MRLVGWPTSTAPFCIDSTEVSNAAYAAFVNGVEAGAPSPSAPSARGTSTFAPRRSGTAPSRPTTVSEVDWCDAFAYQPVENGREGIDDGSRDG
jgi:formylglycine-generating enzyme required for sulfatase activity